MPPIKLRSVDETEDTELKESQTIKMFMLEGTRVCYLL